MNRFLARLCASITHTGPGYTLTGHTTGPWAQTIHTGPDGSLHIPWDQPDGTTGGAVTVTPADVPILAAMLTDLTKEPTE